MTKKLDPDFRALKMADKAMLISTPKMRRHTLEYLWDKYVLNPQRKRKDRQAMNRSLGWNTLLTEIKQQLNNVKENQ